MAKKMIISSIKEKAKKIKEKQENLITSQDLDCI